MRDAAPDFDASRQPLLYELGRQHAVLAKNYWHTVYSDQSMPDLKLAPLRPEMSLIHNFLHAIGHPRPLYPRNPRGLKL